MTESVLKTLNEVDKVETIANDTVTARLNFKITRCDESSQKFEKKKSNVMIDWTQVQLDELQQNIDDLINYKVDLQRLQAAESKSDKYRLTAMVQNALRKLIRERRLKRRKLGSGRKLAMDSLDEMYLLKMIESKSVAHGRRGNEVIYTNQRVKLSQMVGIVSQHRISRGLAPIKSKSTVHNRSRAGNEISRQAKLLIGSGLFCAKKAPKAEDNSNETTHYLRAFKNNVDRYLYETHKNPPTRRMQNTF